MQRLKNIVLGFAFVMLAAVPLVSLANPQVASAASTPPAAPSDCEYRILGMPTWFRGVVKVENGECIIQSPSDFDTIDPDTGVAKNDGLSNFIWKIALNIIEIGLFIAGYVALFFVLYGGFQFLTGGSNPGQVEKARTTILNAVIGLAISMAAIAAVNLIFRLLAP